MSGGKGRGKGKGKRTIQQLEVDQASDVEVEQPRKCRRYCVLRENMNPNAVKYFEGRYDTLMRMRAVAMEDRDAEEGLNKDHCLIDQVFISVQFAQGNQT